MKLSLRYMTLNDIQQVVHIDHAAFSTPWSARTYTYEITESPYSHMVVLEHTARTLIPTWLQGGVRWLQRLRHAQSASQIVAYGGLWRVMEEAHISTIASHPDWRGKRYGEIVLAAMIQRAISLKARYVVLEVRISNAVAQKLYEKYGFQTVTTKRKYYRDNGEDAYEMRLKLDVATCEQLNKRFDALRDTVKFEDTYTQAELIH